MPWLADEKAVALVYGLVRQRRAHPDHAPLDWSAYDIEHRRQGLAYRKAKCLRCSSAAKECFVVSGKMLPGGPIWIDLCEQCGLWIRQELLVLPSV